MKAFSALAVVVLSGLALVAPASANDRQTPIRIVGSSTLYTMTTHVAETFGRAGRFPAPVVESTGSGGGIKLFCSGTGVDTPDIVMASRPMTESEKTQCQSRDIAAPAQFALGTGGVIVAVADVAPDFRLTQRHLWLALAARGPVNGKLVANPYTNWKYIDPSLPDLPIQVYGPPPTSGTHDAMLGMILDTACHEDAVMAALSVSERLVACEKLREDGVYIHAGESDEMLSRRLLANPKAVGIIGFHVLEQHKGLKAASVNGVQPTVASIYQGRYPLVRTLYMYVKREHIRRTPGLEQFVQAYVSDAMIGPEGRLTELGLVPLKEDERRLTAERARTLGPGE